MAAISTASFAVGYRALTTPIWARCEICSGRAVGMVQAFASVGRRQLWLFGMLLLVWHLVSPRQCWLGFADAPAFHAVLVGRYASRTVCPNLFHPLVSHSRHLAHHAGSAAIYDHPNRELPKVGAPSPCDPRSIQSMVLEAKRSRATTDSCR